MQVKSVKLSDLRAFDGNPRSHASDVDALVASVKSYGWTNPILVQKGTMRIVAGHGRALAALKAGMTEVPVIELDLSDRQADAYTIADNKLAERSSWDLPKLKELLVALDDGSGLLELTGFDEKELQFLIDLGVETPLPDLGDEGTHLFEQTTFILSREQAALVKAAVQKAIDSGPFVGTGNENRNGNALARIAEAYDG